MSNATISPAELNAKHAADPSIELIDVRTPLEFREVHVPFAQNVPYTKLKHSRYFADRNSTNGKPLYVICQVGQRSEQACKKLRSAGLDNVINVTGGTTAWERAGLPLTRGEPGMSLERQVRIAAGSLVLLGALLGYFISPYWMGLCAFIGAGLTVAGITNFCGMGMLMARMPWNQVSDSCETDFKTP